MGLWRPTPGGLGRATELTRPAAGGAVDDRRDNRTTRGRSEPGGGARLRGAAVKLLRPRLAGDAVARPRLLAALDAGRDRPLVLLSGPAGYGKTTLLGPVARRPGPRRRPG